MSFFFWRYTLKFVLFFSYISSCLFIYLRSFVLLFTHIHFTQFHCFFSLKSFFFNLPAFVFLFPVYKEKVLFCFMLVLVVNFLTLCITQSFANYLSSGFCVILICYFVFYTFTVYWLYIACVKKDLSLCLL